jgi:hypothetical protein
MPVKCMKLSTEVLDDEQGVVEVLLKHCFRGGGGGFVDCHHGHKRQGTLADVQLHGVSCVPGE